MAEQKLPKLLTSADFCRSARKSSPETILLDQKAGFWRQNMNGPAERQSDEATPNGVGGRMDTLNSIRRPVSRKVRGQPWAGLPRVRAIRSKGRLYLYFNSGGTNVGRQFHRLPPHDSDEFEAVYLAMLTAHRVGSEVPTQGLATNQSQLRKSSVYFIATEGGPIKVGYAASVQSRLAALQSGNHLPLSILATTPGGSRLEREYHKRFAAHRLHGEWFSPHPDILAEIARLNDPQQHRAGVR